MLPELNVTVPEPLRAIPDPNTKLPAVLELDEELALAETIIAAVEPDELVRLLSVNPVLLVIFEVITPLPRANDIDPKDPVPLELAEMPPVLVVKLPLVVGELTIRYFIKPPFVQPVTTPTEPPVPSYSRVAAEAELVPVNDNELRYWFSDVITNAVAKPELTDRADALVIVMLFIEVGFKDPNAIVLGTTVVVVTTEPFT